MKNNLDLLAENQEKVQERVLQKALSMNTNSLLRMASSYGKSKTKKLFNTALKHQVLIDDQENYLHQLSIFKIIARIVANQLKIAPYLAEKIIGSCTVCMGCNTQNMIFN